MRMEELEVVCLEAARSLARRGRPVPASVVLPLPTATRVVALDGWPDNDAGRRELLVRFARDEMGPRQAPCYGFIAEALADAVTELAEADAGAGREQVDVVVVAYGARGRGPRVTAAPLLPGGLGAFTPSEDLDPAALPFLAPLQQAADAVQPAGPGGGPVSPG